MRVVKKIETWKICMTVIMTLLTLGLWASCRHHPDVDIAILIVLIPTCVYAFILFIHSNL